MTTSVPDYFFERTGPATFAPTIHGEGAWSNEDYHFACLAGLITHVIEQYRLEHDGGKLDLSRISFDILGRLPFKEATIEVAIKRPGRTIELVEAICSIGERPVIIARAWYLIPTDTADVFGVEFEPLPAPGACPPRDMTSVWNGGLIAQVEARQPRAYRPGRAAAWITSPNHLVKDEEPIAIAEFVSRIDVANGIAVREDPTHFAFPNVDLTVHFFRQPVGEWTGLDTRVSWGPHGLGLTSSTLHDVEGPVGRAEQSLTVRAM